MSLVDVVFPKSCLLCSKGGTYICIACLRRVKSASGVCIECEKPAIDGMTHIKCKKKQSLDGSVSLWTYQGVVRKAMIAMKYKYAYKIAEEMSGWAVQVLRQKFTAFPNDNILLPIPLHKKRRNWRGFNQSEEMAKLISKKMGWKFIPDLIIREKYTIPQASLSEKERKKNVLGIFSLNPNYRILSTNYIVFDDVWTTGATLREAGKVLKRNGAKTVWGLTIAR